MNSMDDQRRSFLKTSLGAAAIVIAPGMLLFDTAHAKPQPASGKVRWGMLVDTTRCRQGCDECVQACHKENGVAGGTRPTDSQWIRKVELKDIGSGRELSLPMMCQHCEHPPCVDVCPTTASFRRADGIVLVDKHRCIGCRYCMMACPYKARSFVHEPLHDQNPDVPRGKGTVEACTLCVHRVDRGQQPACSERCPNKAILFGDLNDPSSDIAKRIRSVTTVQVRADLRLNPGIRYEGLQMSVQSPTRFFDPAQAKFKNRLYYALLGAGSLIVAAGLYAVYLMEHHGHITTGMDNQIVWGLPHVFAIFLIVAASGVLNVASIGSVFGKSAYKARAPLAGLLSIAMLAGGLAVLMLDLGRPDRMIVAMTNYNPTSMFAWNVPLYSGMFALVFVYLWTMMERRMNLWSKTAGLAVFVWRFMLTTGTGLIFAFLVARQAYASALLPPLFIVISFAWGLAVYLVTQAILYAWSGKTLAPEIELRMKNLLGVFVIGALYLVAAYHLTNMYFAHQTGFESFILVDGGIHPQLFWWGYVVLGNILPLSLIYLPGQVKAKNIIAASLLVILGGFAFLYVFIIGGQAYPLDIFPGYEANSTFGDGQIFSYRPSLYELLLGIGGLGIAFLIVAVGARALNFMPNDKAQSAD